jgi:hypothetical protein
MKKSLASLLIVLLLLSLCSGCSGYKYHRIYIAGVIGGVVGGIIGHQSDETTKGAVLGAAVFATGEFLRQTDEISNDGVAKAADDLAKGSGLLASRDRLEPNRSGFER